MAHNGVCFSRRSASTNLKTKVVEEIFSYVGGSKDFQINNLGVEVPPLQKDHSSRS